MEFSLTSVVLTDWVLLLVLFVVLLGASQVLVRESMAAIVSFYPALFFSEYAEHFGAKDVVLFLAEHTGIEINPFFFAYIPSLIIFVVLFRSWMAPSFSITVFESALLALAFVILYSVTFIGDIQFLLFDTLGLTLSQFWQSVVAMLPLAILFFIAID